MNSFLSGINRTLYLLISLIGFSQSFENHSYFNSFNSYSAPRPNIIVILADDLGFSDLGSYGAEIIKTPNLDSLAFGGMRFTDFYNTARCWITRVSLLSGRYHHRAGVKRINANSVTISEVLKTANYNTVAVGKWHVETPHPVDRGFDEFFGLIDGCAHYFYKDPCNGTNQVMKHNNDIWQVPANGFYITDEFSDSAVAYIDKYAPMSDPFFLYLAYTAPHWPLHALPEDIALYRGKFAGGWDQLRQNRFQNLKKLGLIPLNSTLPPRTSGVPAWVNATDKLGLDLEMAVYAAQIHRMDLGIGRVMDKLQEHGEFENTLIMFLSDNGAANEKAYTAEANTNQGGEIGTPESFAAYDEGWANASNTPFRGYKGNTMEGGIRTPFIIHWPDVIKKPFISKEPGHLVDIMPTILDLAGAQYPTTYNNKNIVPFDGRTLFHVIYDGSRSDPNQIYYDHGDPAIRQGKFKAKRVEGRWQLYDLSVDPFEMNNIASQNQAKVNELVKLWNSWKASNKRTQQDIVPTVNHKKKSKAESFGREHINQLYTLDGKKILGNTELKFLGNGVYIKNKGLATHIH